MSDDTTYSSVCLNVVVLLLLLWWVFMLLLSVVVASPLVFCLWLFLLLLTLSFIAPRPFVSLALPPPLPASSWSAAHSSRHSHGRRLMICHRRLLFCLYLQSMTQTRAAARQKCSKWFTFTFVRENPQQRYFADSLPPRPTTLLFTTINIAAVPLDCKVKQKMISEAAPEGK